MIDLKQYGIWFVTSSQHLYGPKTLEKVAQHSQQIASYFNQHDSIPVKVIYKAVVKTPGEIFDIMEAANQAKNCVGLIT